MAGEDKDYDYKPRETVPMPEQSFRIGDGKISGFLSVALGVLSLLGVLCYRYPSYLTTAELRASYDADVLQQVLMWGMFASLIFALLTFILGKRRRLGAIGVLFIAAAYALGGYTIETGPVERSPLAFGLDWLILAFVVSACHRALQVSLSISDSKNSRSIHC